MSVTTIVEIAVPVVFWSFVLLWVALWLIEGHASLKGWRARRRERNRVLDILVEREQEKEKKAMYKELRARRQAWDSADYWLRHPELAADRPKKLDPLVQEFYDEGLRKREQKRAD